MSYKAFYTFVIIFLISLTPISGNAQTSKFIVWDRNISKKSIELSELRAGGLPKDGIQSINNPTFIHQENASWLADNEPVIAVEINGETSAYPPSISKKQKVIKDNIAGTSIVVFHVDGASSALDQSRISESKEAGSTGVFWASVDGNLLTSAFKNGEIVDEQTKSTWDITGEAVSGKLKGVRLK